MAPTTQTRADATAIRPFTFDFSDAEIAELRSRVAATRWPEKEPVDDQSHGVQLATIQAVAKYWASEYDWRSCEARLKAVPHFVTEIDGLDIHFVHVRSHHEDALPVLVTHGWPGSVVEQLKIVDPLVNPTAHGGSASDAFDVVIPSMPGYGFSGRPAETGWGPERIARAWAVLMERLGYSEYVAAGGDWGAVITDILATQEPAGLIGIHTNMAGVVPAEVEAAAASGGDPPAGLTADETQVFEQLKEDFRHFGYAHELGSHPQTMYAVADSPIGLAAWLLDHDQRSYASISRVFLTGEPFGELTRDEVLDNVTLFWLTNTAVSSGRLYRENKLSFFGPKGVSLPTAVSVFPDELYTPPRTWAERAYPNLIHYNKELGKGGHFAAWGEPQAYSEEIRSGFRSLR